jgi:hypothetical protein
MSRWKECWDIAAAIQMPKRAMLLKYIRFGLYKHNREVL